MKKYIIFDLEATCWEDKNIKPNEIIEVGAVALNEKLEIIDTFDMFIKPIVKPTLSDFCKELTHINQSDVDNAKSFKEVINAFEKWCGSDVKLCSWGFYDKNQIINESKLKNYNGNISNMLKYHISIKHQFGDIKGIKPCGTQKALKMLGLNFNGTQHRAIDDAKNITKIFIQIFNDLKFI